MIVRRLFIMDKLMRRNKWLRSIGIVLLCFLAVFALSGCSTAGDAGKSEPQLENKGGDGMPNQGKDSDQGSEPPGQGGDQPVSNQDELRQWEGLKAKVINDNYPAEISRYLETNREKETQQSLNVNNKTYLVLTMGQKPSAGYGIDLKDLSLKDGTLNVQVKYIQPGKNVNVATVITYPSLVIETDDIYEGHYLIEFDLEK